MVINEHNLDVVKSADYIIDMGPEGDGGGMVVVALLEITKGCGLIYRRLS